VMNQARLAAQSLLRIEGLDRGQRIELAYRQSLGRLPAPRERQLALEYLAASDDVAAWERFYQTLFACVDFRYVN